MRRINVSPAARSRSADWKTLRSLFNPSLKWRTSYMCNVRVMCDKGRTWVRAMMSSCSTRWDSALPSELTLHKMFQG